MNVTMDLSNIANFQDAVVTVMGLGRYKRGSGLGATKWLMRHGAQTVITDLKDSAELKESVELVMEWYTKYRQQYPDQTIYQPVFVLGEHRKEDFVNVQCVVQNPGVPSEADYAKEAKANAIPIESDVSLFFRFYKHPTIGVTGTKGKTTTTLMIAAMLKAWDASSVVAGNIKISPLEYLDDLLTRPAATPVVIEFSSWMLESMPVAFADMQKGPDIAVLTNVYPDHLDRYGSYEAYIASKHILFEHQTPEQFTVLNYDHDRVRAMEPLVKGKLFWFSRHDMEHDGCFVKDGKIVFKHAGQSTEILPVAEVAFKGEGSLENVLSSVCAAMLRGVPIDAIQQVLRAFVGSDEREELVREVDEITFINDTNATAPAMAAEAIGHFAHAARKDLFLVAGGEGVEDVVQMAEAAKATCKMVLLLPGAQSDALAAAIGSTVPVEHVATMRDAVQKARSAAQKGDIVLLSPGTNAGAAFGSAFERGELFREEVRNL